MARGLLIGVSFGVVVHTDAEVFEGDTIAQWLRRSWPEVAAVEAIPA